MSWRVISTATVRGRKRRWFPSTAAHCRKRFSSRKFSATKKGAFSGANQTKHGLIEVADGTTLFLDEIGELPIALQVKLLRFLESGEFRRVGATRALFSDTRLIAATNQDLPKAIKETRFSGGLVLSSECDSPAPAAAARTSRRPAGFD